MPSERFSDGIALFFFPMFDIPKHSLTLSYKFIKIPPFVKLISDELALFNRCRTQIRRCGKADAGIVRLRRCFVVAVRPARRRGNGIPHPPLLRIGARLYRAVAQYAPADPIVFPILRSAENGHQMGRFHLRRNRAGFLGRKLYGGSCPRRASSPSPKGRSERARQSV